MKFSARIPSISLLLILISVSIYSQTSSNGLILSLTFDGDTKDGSGNSFNATAFEATLTNDRYGKSNSAYLFDGVNDYMTVPDTLPLRLSNTDFTISVWVKLNEISSDYASAIIAKRTMSNGSGYGFFARGTGPWTPGQVVYSVSGGTDPSSVTDSIMPLNSWQHLVLKYNLNAQTSYTYFNGVLVYTKTGIPTPNANSNVNMVIGNDATGNSYYFKGIIDDIQIYNKALSDSEITAKYNEVTTKIENHGEVSLNKPMHIFPNPVSGIINLKVTEPAKIYILDITGREVYKGNSSIGILKIDLSSQPKGMYFVKSFADGQISIARFFLE